MEATQFFIEMDHQVLSFFPGQVISGRVVLKSTKNTKTEGIKVRFLGSASVRWEESRQETTGTGDNQTTRTVTDVYSNQEKYFNDTIHLIAKVSLLPGRHAYPFTYQLPLELPSSFKGSYGTVSYGVQAIMKRSWKFDRKAFVPFTVNAIVDLNKDPIVVLPTELRKHKNICCLCCKSGPVGFQLKLPRVGYVPGERILITAEIFNQSRRNVEYTVLSLHQVITYHARSKSRTEVKLICRANGPSVDRGESEHWVGNALQIPPIPPTSRKNEIIDIQYFLRIKLHLSGPSTNLKESCTLVIGSIPLRSTFQIMQGPQENQRDHQQMAYDPSTFPVPSAPAFNEYPDLPPPTYAEAVSIINTDPSKEQTVGENMVTDDENTFNGDYKPNYIAYGWFPPGSHSHPH